MRGYEWRAHPKSGEVYAVEYDAEKIVRAAGPIPYEDYADEEVDPADWISGVQDDEEALGDGAWLQHEIWAAAGNKRR
tara:strand:- start:281 stop:514 length:234 start_codon:yes stop_codon:yes gene_type:complete